MKKSAGERAEPIELQALNGTRFDSRSLSGLCYMISFFRFAGCPFCNLRVHDLVSNFDGFGPGFTIVGIFDASLQDLQRHVSKHQAPFPILADETNRYYREYGIERSVTGVFKGMVLRFPSLMRAMFAQGYLPTTIGGNLMTMPADFLVDEQGVIRLAHYGKDEGDHLPLERVRAFAHGSR